MRFREWLELYGKAWRERDAKGLGEIFTDNAVYRSQPFREPHVGTEAIREYWRQATADQEEIDLRFGTPIVAGSRAAVEWWAQIRTGGEEITLPGILYLRFAADGRCEELREAWHVQEGRHDPPSGWGS
ncbi:MAG: nuclear transport factor 2 family protein [Actinomycetota bacterium]